MNSSQETDLSDILVFHLNGGENILINVSGKYIRQADLERERFRH